jgi:uncharacterized protein (DUF2235 family)
VKRLVFCFDGTWNRLDAPDPTNVVKLAEGVIPSATGGVTQIIHYDQGVGTGDYDRWLGGLFGAGLLTHLSNAYQFLIFNYEVGDEIYVFGFSRGAYTARAFVGFLQNCGIILRHHAGRISDAIALYKSRTGDHDATSLKFQEFRAKYAPDMCVDEVEDQWRAQNCPGYKTGQAPILRVRYVGVWDTVGSLGVPDTFLIAPFINRKYKFYDTSLTDVVVNARHAVAIDEKRKSFSPTLWTNLADLNRKLGFVGEEKDAPYQQQWFPGVHGGVGGGGDIRGLSDAALDWIMSGAREAGLQLDISAQSVLFDLKPDYCAPLDNVTAKGFSLVDVMMAHLPQTDRAPGPDRLSDVSATAASRWRAGADELTGKMLYRPKTLARVADELDRPAALRAQPLAVAPATPSTALQAGPRPPFYTVIRGDTLGGIALRFYGDANQATPLFNANPMLTDANRIYVGQVLQLPQL